MSCRRMRLRRGSRPAADRLVRRAGRVVDRDGDALRARAVACDRVTRFIVRAHGRDVGPAPFVHDRRYYESSLLSVPGPSYARKHAPQRNATAAPGFGTKPSSRITCTKQFVYSSAISPDTSRVRPHSAHVTVARASIATALPQRGTPA